MSSTHGHGDSHGPIEARLRAGVEAPSEGFVSDLEARLLPPAPAPAGATRPLLAGGLAATALAAAAVGLGLVGQGPLATGGEESAQAGAECRQARITEPARVPVLDDDGPGGPELRYRERLVERTVERCP